MLHNPTGKERLGLALLLSLLGILGPFNIDMYLPSFPEIADDLGARASLVQLSLTSCLIGLAVGQIIVGPISDAQGRRKPLIISLVLFALSSLFCALAPHITALVIARFLQGFTAAAGLVISRAVVRDVFSGRELTKFFALLSVINAVAPMVAPMSGGAILLMPGASWHSIFYF
ncbi:bicyclomycin resistance family protein [Paenibacillus sp. HGF5]|nr:bicyclomycin resistance family protein [Paenibacillus sp. HGF5]